MLTTSGGWFELHRRIGVFDADSRVIVVKSRNAEIASLAAAAQVLMKFGLYSQEREPRFEENVLLFPPGKIADALRAETIGAMQRLMQEEGAGEFTIKLAPLMFDARALTTLESAGLVGVVRAIPSRASCTIYSPELFRYADLDVPVAQNKPTPQREIASRHFERLVRELSSVAIDNHLVIVLFCDQARLDASELQLDEHENFAFVELTTQSLPENPPVEVAPFMEPFREGGWPAVKVQPQYPKGMDEHIAFQLADAFAQSGEIAQAWKAVEPHAVRADRFTAATQLSMAAGAYTADDWDAGVRLLRSAFSEGLQTAEELFMALNLADSLREQELFTDVIEQLRRTFPENRLTARAEYLALFNKRDFAGALKMAEQLNLTVETAQCRAFLSPVIDASEFLIEMEKLGDREQGLMSCADEAIFRQHGCQAIAWARMIPEDHQLFDRACLARLRALRIGLRKGAVVFCTKELEMLMQHIAAHPARTDLRRELERLLEFGLEEPLVRVMLSNILSALIERQAQRDDESITQARSLHAGFDFGAGAQTEQDFQKFIEGFQKTFEESPGQNIHIGEGKLPDSLAPLIGAKLLLELAEGVVNTDIRQDLEMAVVWVHAICLVGNELGDPDTDFTVLQCIIESQATLGAAQDARDLAETALQLWPQSQPAFLSWRISQGWAALAEACLRSNNSLAALRYLCWSLLAHEAPALDLELLRRLYRMAARIFRNLHDAPFALRCIALEKEFLSKINPSAQSVSLEVLHLQIALPAILNSPLEDQLKALEHSEELLRLGEASELYPLTAIQASILRLLPSAKVPLGIQSNFQERLKALPESLQRVLRSANNPEPTKAEIAALIEALPDAQDHQYLAYQISSALPAVSNALRFALDSGDPELYFLAAGAFAQPSLGVQSAPPAAQPNRSSILRTTTLEGLRSGKLETVERYSFIRLATSSVQQLQSCLDEKECALIISGEPGFQPSCILVSYNSVVGPRLITSWSTEAFGNWASSFKKNLYWNKPKQFIPGLDSLGPPVHQIKSIFANLSLGLVEVPEKLTIVPAAHLVGFTWQLSPFKDGFLGEKTCLAIAPSAAWLVAARTTPWTGEPKRKAWIGSAESQDSTLIALREQVGPHLDAHGFLQSSAHAPFDFGNSEIAFIGAHGGTGIADYFRSVSDRVNYFAPSEFARMLAGCGCVILAVCSGGRSDRKSGNLETLGLVSALFRNGVRCAVAPPWPLDIEVVQYWLPAFLDAMDHGQSVGEAATKARDAVRNQLDHPCAWGQLHVYGDQQFRLIEV